MKLRIRGNSVRIRLTQSELGQLAQGGIAEDCVRFSPNAQLRYRVQVEPSGAVGADLDGDRLAVRVPRDELERWLAPEEVSIRGEQAIGEGETLKILVEKDFVCLTPREGEEDASDLFPNPSEQAC